MNKIISFFSMTFILMMSCNSNTNKTFNIEGDLKGLTKGTVYLEKVQDTMIVIIDSFSVHNEGKFRLGDNLKSPEIYYIRIKEIPNEKLLIFGEQGTINITGNLDRFSTSSNVIGSTNNDLLVEYNKMIQKFNNKSLDIFKANFEFEKSNNRFALDSLDKIYKNHIKTQYLYTTNFAVKHADKEVAPYLALTQLYNANIQLLDTVNNSLSPNVRKSKYGKKLNTFIAFIKKNEPIK